MSRLGLHVGKDLICLCVPIAGLSINFSHLIRCFNHNIKEAYLNSCGFEIVVSKYICLN